MLKVNHITTVLMVVAVLGGCVTTTREAQRKNAVSLDKAHFRQTMTVRDDSLDTVAKFSTNNGFKVRRGLLRVVWDDNFIRASVHKKTGITAFQVYNSIYYTGSGWRFYQRVNHETPSGPKSKEVTVIARDVNCTNGCIYNEHVAFSVDQALLETIANKYSQGIQVDWQYKIMPKAGGDYRDGLLPAEIAALVEMVNEYKKSKGL
jgi:hypothetical protein